MAQSDGQPQWSSQLRFSIAIRNLVRTPCYTSYDTHPGSLGGGKTVKKQKTKTVHNFQLKSGLFFYYFWTSLIFVLYYKKC